MGLLLHLDEKRSQPLFAGSPASNSREAIRKVDFDTNIRNFMANVKWENSGQEKYTAESELEGKTAFMAAYEAARTEKANRQNEPQYSLTQATEGRKMNSRARRDVNQTMNAVQTELRGLIEAEHPFSTILSDAQPVYLGKDLPGEYRESEYSKSMPRRLRAVKMQAATNLDEMLLLAENGEWRENVKPKHARDAKNGWYRYETQFAVPVLNAKKAIDRYTVYGGTLLIRNDADGKSYLYDLLDIEKKKVISTASFSAKPHSEVYAPKPSSEDSIRNFMANVKWENSGQEKYTAESELEGKTAFMAAYEAARTEKANRQNEPQYSLTQATEGRKMNSRARRDVNQTMNAVQIAGDKKTRERLALSGTWYARRDSNPQPSEPESDALSIEPLARLPVYYNTRCRKIKWGEGKTSRRKACALTT